MYDCPHSTLLPIFHLCLYLNFLHLIFQGEEKKSIEQLKLLINEGVEPKSFLNDLLEIIYLIQQKKNIGNFETDSSISESEKEISIEEGDDVGDDSNDKDLQYIPKIESLEK